MTEMSFSGAEYADKRKQTRREIFLVVMEQEVSREALLALIEQMYATARNGRHPYAIKTMLRIQLLQNCLATVIGRWKKRCMKWCRFAGLSLTRGSVPEETMTLNFWHLIESNDLAPKVLAAKQPMVRFTEYVALGP